MLHRSKTAWRRLTTLLVTVFSLAAAAGAQVEQGRFVGHIQDPTGAIVVGATVEATNTGTNIKMRALTNDGGDFVITPVLAGNYILTVTATGFQKATTKVIEVQVGQIVRQDLILPIGTANTVVEVTSTAPLLSTDSATVLAFANGPTSRDDILVWRHAVGLADPATRPVLIEQLRRIERELGLA